MARQAVLYEDDIFDLVKSILDGVDHVEHGAALSERWPQQMRDWCERLLAQLHGET